MNTSELADRIASEAMSECCQLASESIKKLSYDDLSAVADAIRLSARQAAERSASLLANSPWAESAVVTKGAADAFHAAMLVLDQRIKKESD